MRDLTKERSSLEKKKLLEELLSQDYALVHVNTAIGELAVPPHLMSNPTVTLKLSRQFRKPVEIKKDGVHVELRFSGNYFTCFLPWDSIWGMTGTSQETRIWGPDVPAAVLAQMGEEVKKLGSAAAVAAPEQTTEKKEDAPVATLREVPPSSENKPDPDDKPKGAKTRPLLRRVK